VLSGDRDDQALVLQAMRYIEYWQPTLDRDCKENFWQGRVAVMGRKDHRHLREFSRFLGLDFWTYPIWDPELLMFDPRMNGWLDVVGFQREKFFHGMQQVSAQFFQGVLKTPLEQSACWYALGQAKKRLMGWEQDRSIFSFLSYQPGYPYMASLTQWAEKTLKNLVLQGAGQQEFLNPQPGHHRDRQKDNYSGHPWDCLSRHPRDHHQWITFFCEDHGIREHLSPEVWAGAPGLEHLSHSCGLDFIKQAWQHQWKNLENQGHGIRLLRVHSFQEESLGALMMNHVLESLLIGSSFFTHRG
jgi:hypothetical protein